MEQYKKQLEKMSQKRLSNEMVKQHMVTIQDYSPEKIKAIKEESERRRTK